MLCPICNREMTKAEEANGICQPCASGQTAHLNADALEKATAVREAIRQEAEAREKEIGQILLTTETYVQDLTIHRRFGVVTAECVFGMNLLKDIMAGITDVLGGRSQATQNILRDSRQVALQELKREASLLGANGVIGVSVNYSEFSGKDKSMILVVAVGTAVLYELD